MEIKGLAKTTLLDYPGRVAATVFTGECQFKCPYCHNGSLVNHSDRLETISEEAFFEFLEERRGILDGVCVTGGEPTLHKDLPEFLEKIKAMDYEVKLDTNGYEPGRLRDIIKAGLVDYVAMDVKHSQNGYKNIVGMSSFDLTRIKLSVDILKDIGTDYEFRTTVVKEFHSLRDMEDIGRWLTGAKAYYLQPYKESPDVILPVFSTYDPEHFLQLRRAVKKYVPRVYIRGLDV